MTAARQFRPHYTVEDYLHWPGDWELWFGTAVSMSPSPFGPHERTVSELSYRIQASIRSQACDSCLYTGLDWLIQPDTVVRPDVMVVCGAQPQQHLERPPSLIVEVLSPATADKDLGPKRDLYQSQRVPHYLIIDPETNGLQWLRLEHGQYNQQPTSNAIQCRLHDNCVIEFAW